MKIIKFPKQEKWDLLLKRPTQTVEDIEKTVLHVFDEIKSNKDAAIKDFTKKFDGVTLENIQVSTSEILQAETNVSSKLKEAITVAKNNITAFHSAQKTEKVVVETSPGVQCWQVKKPIQTVGLYIPGGSAPLFSTILMLAVPAMIAGCEDIVLCSPPDKDGNIHPAILYTANLCGVTQIFKVGGIQAVGAMTFGTPTIPAVSKIFGPGNQYVTVAKQIATKYGVAIDMPAGPSELLVFSDKTGNASFIAADLLSQAEHGPDSQVIFISTDAGLITAVNEEVAAQLNVLPRKEIAAQAIANSKLILVLSTTEALDMINQYAPEHFIVITEDEDFFIENIKNAGSVFIGNYTPESAGDYASGTNHTLPTNGYAKQYSGVNLDSFLKSITFQKITKKGIENLGSVIETMAAAEGLEAHKNAVTLRLKSLQNN